MSTVYPNAKINLGLNITARRPDGYHNLETIFLPIGLTDRLTIEATAGHGSANLSTSGIVLDSADADNLVTKAYRLLHEEFSLPAVRIHLEKRIPFGAGLGGGSADAAFAMMELNRMFGLGLTDGQMQQRLATLGADCPFFVYNRPVFATGIGDRLSPAQVDLSGLYLLLAKPNVAVSTREAYAGIHPQPTVRSVAEIVATTPVEQWDGKVVNDFEPHVFKAHPEIADVKARMYAHGAVYASMSGSGASVFGLFRANDVCLDAFRDCFLFSQRF